MAPRAAHLLTVRQVALRLSCSPRTVERFAQAGALRGARRDANGYWLVPESSVAIARVGQHRRGPQRVVRRLSPSEIAHAVKREPFLPSRVGPSIRAECERGPRPCPHVSCRYHLLLDVAATGALIVNTAGELEDMPETCALDVAGRHGVSAAVVARLLHMPERRVEQIEHHALLKISVALAARQ